MSMSAFAKNSFRITILLVSCIALCTSLVALTPDSAFAVKTYKQKKYALASYDMEDYKVLKNKNYGKVKLTSRESNPVFNLNPHSYKTRAGNKSASMTTFAYLPVSYQRSGDMGNPQSLNITPDGKYAYIVHPKTKNSTTCRIVRYDLEHLAMLGIDVDNMDQLVRAAHNHYTNRENDQLQMSLMSCVKFGPWVKDFGHGQAVSYNPKDGCLWVCGRTHKQKTNLMRINMNTLKPDMKIVFRLKKGIKMGTVLAFDKRGYFYYYTYAGKGYYLSKGTIKLYRGKITKSHKVRLKLIMQGIRNSPSAGIQSMGYNPASDRLYLLGNGTVMSIPTAKLGKLKKSDIRVSIFTGKREYEGIAFDAQGNGYVLLNGRPELMKLSGGF